MTSAKDVDAEDWDEDYITRCICGFVHDDGFMICCDACSVWQHIECVQVDPRHLPENYHCELCAPRSVDRKRARAIQLKKKEDMTAEGSDAEEGKSSSRSKPPAQLSAGAAAKKKKAKQKAPLTPGGVNKNGKEVKKKPKEEPIRTRKPSRSSDKPPLAHPLPSSSSGEDQGRSLWSCSSSPWSDPYEVISTSRVSEQVKALVQLKAAQVKADAISMSKAEYSVSELRQPKCVVVDVQKKRKGVLTEASLQPKTAVMEYKGRYTLRHVVSGELGLTGRSLWRERPCPFVYCYEKISGIDLAIDARNYGNIARFIRRACNANCMLCHLLVEGELLVCVYSAREVSAGEELTIPFDFQFEHCDYAVECGCGQGPAECAVERANQSLLSRRGSADKRAGPDFPIGLPLNSRKRRRTTSSLNSPNSTHSVGVGNTNEVESPSLGLEGDSPSEDTLSSRARKKKSREERKVEQYVKMFSSMEAQQARPRRKEEEAEAGQGGRGKKKTGRLSSSLQWDDTLLPTDPSCELASPTDSDLLSPLLLVSPTLHLSPPPSPPPKPKPEMSFKVRPFTHPGYLFGNFPPSAKKALLARWTLSQSRLQPPPEQPTLVDALGSHVCPKKKWMKLHYQQLVNSPTADVASLPMKRRVLRQWERGHALSAVSSAGQEEGEEEEVERQEKKASPLFDDFSDDDTFQYVSDSEPASHQVGGDTPPPAGPRTPSTTPPYSPESISSGEGAGAGVHTPITPTEPEEEFSKDSCGQQLSGMGSPEVSASPGDESAAMTMQQTGKKKVSLREYRSRTRKVEVQRDPAEDDRAMSVQSTPPTNPTLSLAQALTSLASSLFEDKPAPMPVATLPPSGDYQFEPVSPEEEEQEV